MVITKGVIYFVNSLLKAQMEVKHKIYSDTKHVGEKSDSPSWYVLYSSKTKTDLNYS
jgi:hypothetical protein